MTAHPDYWNAFYDDEARPGWDMARPTPVLEEALTHASAAGLAPGASVVVPGCGYGHDAAGLEAGGFVVTGLDFAPLALQGARARYGDRITWSSADWFSPQLGPWDAIFDHTCFVAMDPGRRRDYVEACARHLKPGGLWMAVVFDDVQGRPGPPHAIPLETCRELAIPYFEILHLARAAASHPRRAGRELLMVARRRQD
ncbi:methyltransferase domain-containing protein [Geothrix mesophila]|uniref:methyltransferase domain-containing protein n=1 Tax=Geothrix mesophila TaxID=2922723 RepID=UPI001FAE5C20|nr:methyltransferase domain-containing protein [Geothrix sp. SG198]